MSQTDVWMESDSHTTIFGDQGTWINCYCCKQTLLAVYAKTKTNNNKKKRRGKKEAERN